MMLKNLLFIALSVLILGCNSAQKGFDSFGKEITAEGAIPVTEVTKLLESKDSASVKLTGKVVECCQSKGCWMTLDLGNGENMRVSFKDYGFFVPKNSVGKNAIIEGWAYRTETPVDELKHYAEDAGKSQEEIEKITEPEREITFVADGALLSVDEKKKK